MDPHVGVERTGGQVRLQYGYDAYGLRHVYGEPCDVLRSARCDCNCDGTATWRDIDYLIAALNDNVAGWTQFYADQHGGALPPCDFWCVNDLDGDGHVTWRDINPFIECMNQVLPPWPPAQPYGFAGREVDLDVRARRDPNGAADLGTLHERETQFDPNALPVLVLHHYRARSYDPWHGRFYQRDPALYADSMNLYEYVRSRPATGRDPTGRFGFSDVLSAANQVARLYSRYSTANSVREMVIKLAAGVSLQSVLIGAAIEIAIDKAGGKMLDSLVDYTAALRNTFAKRFAKFGKINRLVERGRSREAYEAMYGQLDEGWVVHHKLPNEFRDFFQARGLNPDDPLWLAALPGDLHQDFVHHLDEFAWNGKWRVWISAHPNATSQQIIDFMNNLYQEMLLAP